MIYLNEETKQRIKDLDINNMYVVADFDETITSGARSGSWDILETSELISPEYVKEADALYNHYYPLEFDPSIDSDTKEKLMCEWWNKSISLFNKYKITEEVLNKIITSSHSMKFRRGVNSSSNIWIKEMYQ